MATSGIGLNSVNLLRQGRDNAEGTIDSREIIIDLFAQIPQQFNLNNKGLFVRRIRDASGKDNHSTKNVINVQY